MFIQSTQNPLIVQLSKLQQKKYRELTKTYLVYGANIIAEAKKAKQIVYEITTDRAYESSNQVIYVTSAIMKKLCPVLPLPHVIAQVKMLSPHPFDNQQVLVIDEIQDPGNLGTILRTARAFGLTNVFIGDHTVDVYNPKVVAAMQGVEFGLNLQYGDVYAYLQASPLPIITTFLDEDNQVSGTQPAFNLVVGNEGRGINPLIKNLPHQNKKIAITFESLNVAVATGIIINEFI